MRANQGDRKRRIQWALQERDVRQRDIATLLGIAEPTVSRIISGTYQIRSVRSKRTREKVLAALSEKTGLPIEELRELTTAEQAA